MLIGIYGVRFRYYVGVSPVVATHNPGLGRIYGNEFTNLNRQGRPGAGRAGTEYPKPCPDRLHSPARLAYIGSRTGAEGRDG